MPDTPAKKIVCVYVRDGMEVFREEETMHPGMDTITKEWEQDQPVIILFPKLQKGLESNTERVKVRARFSWHSMNSKGEHIFHECKGHAGDTI